MTAPAGPRARRGDRTICVAGLGVSGTAAARVLAARGEKVVVLENGDGERARAGAAALAGLGVEVRLGKQIGRAHV